MDVVLKIGEKTPSSHQWKGTLHQILRINWAFAYKNFCTGSSCLTAGFWLAVRIRVSLSHLWDRSHVLM